MSVLTSAYLSVATKSSWKTPHLDYHALAPEIVLCVAAIIVLLVDLFTRENNKRLISTLSGLGIAAAGIPVLTLALSGDARVMFGGAYVVDNFALLAKGVLLFAGYIVVLLSHEYIYEGDYQKGEYSFLLLSSLLGMLVMASARDLLTIFIALETLSIPAYLLAGWRKRDRKSNEASIKYYLLGVLASTIMLYGMSFLYGIAGDTKLSSLAPYMDDSIALLGMFLVLCGFAFKVSAVPFHNWAPDTYEGAPTPVTAFLSVASKIAAFVAILQLVFVSFGKASDVWQPLFWVLSAVTMIVGNLIALKQTNIVRMLAYSSIAQAGFILAPFAVAWHDKETSISAFNAVMVYLVIYAFMNLGAFTMVISIARKTKSGKIASLGGLFSYAPVPAVILTLFMFSLAGIPPISGFWGKFFVFRVLMQSGSGWGYILAAIGAVNSVIGFFYYGSVMREMWMRPVPDGDTRSIKLTPSLKLAAGLCIGAIMIISVLPSSVTHLVDQAKLVHVASK